MAISAEQRRALEAGLRAAQQRRDVTEAFGRALDTAQANGREQEILRRAAVDAPLVFLDEAIKRLRDKDLSSVQRSGNAKLFDVPEVLDLFIDAPCFDTPELVEFFVEVMPIDPLLDIKLGQLLPQPEEDPMPSERLLRLLSVLEQVSPGPRLLLLLNRLSAHTDPGVAQKVALLIGQRLHNKSWIDRQMKSSDGMVRANVLEALWGVPSRFTMGVYQKALLDPCSRVVGNAIVGMHLQGDGMAVSRVRTMLRDERREFRLTGLWTAGRIEAFELRPQLNEAANSTDDRVRDLALRSLEALDVAEVRLEEKRQKAEEARAKRKKEVEEGQIDTRGGRKPHLEFNYMTSVRRG